MPPRVAAVYARLLAQTIRGLHRVGVVHRDVTLWNIFISEGDGDQTLELIDLSHGAVVDSGANARLTQVHEVPGTPGFMSPEQARGEAADPSMDVYAFGVVLYEMLTGRHPFGVRDRQEFIGMQAAGALTLQPIEDKDGVPTPLADLIRDCTAVAADRIEMNDVVQRLERVLAEMVVPSPADSTELTAAADVLALAATGRSAPEAGEGRSATAIPREWKRAVLSSTRATDNLGSPVTDTETTKRQPPPTPAAVPVQQPRRATWVWVAALAIGVVVGASIWGLGHADTLEDGLPPAATASSGSESLVTARTHSAAPPLDAEPEPEAEPVSEKEPEPEPESQARAEPAPDEEPEPEVQPQPDAEPPPEAEPEPRPEPEAKARPKRRPDRPKSAPPAPATNVCEGVIEDARAARSQRAWGKVLRLTATAKCWREQRALRTELRTRAHLEKGEYARCASTGSTSNDPAVRRWAGLCKRKLQETDT